MARVHWKSKLSKYGINKKFTPIFVLFNEIFFWKDSADFWLWKVALKLPQEQKRKQVLFHDNLFAQTLNNVYEKWHC